MTLDLVRDRLGWAYASYWVVDPTQNALVFSADSGEVDAEFHRVTRSAKFREGEGLNGRAWKQRATWFMSLPTLGDLARIAVGPSIASRSGIRSSVCFPRSSWPAVSSGPWTSSPTGRWR